MAISKRSPLLRVAFVLLLNFVLTSARIDGFGEWASLGEGPAANSLVSSIPRFVSSASAGRLASYAVDAQGSLWSWGDNGNSQTGLGTGVTHVTPQIVGGSLVGRTVVQACGGSSHGLAVTDDGVVHSFGTNTAGQLGTSAVPASGEVRNVPAAVYSTTGGLSGKFAIGVACGYTTSFVLLSDRTVVAFGDNTNGALGIGSADPSSNLPTAVSGLTNVASIAAGQHHAIAVTVTGDVYTWGSNDYGQLGITLTTPSSGTPIAQSSGSIVRNVVAGRDFSLIVYADGTAKAFGRNDVGQLGINSISPNEPVSTNVYTAGALAGFSILDAGAGPDFAFLIAIDYSATPPVRRLFSFGDNTGGILADGTQTNSSAPVAVRSTAYDVAQVGVKSVSVGTNHVTVLTPTGAVWNWANTQNSTAVGASHSTGPVLVDTRANIADPANVIIRSYGFSVSVNPSTGAVFIWGDSTPFGSLINPTAMTPKSGALNVDEMVVDAAVGLDHVLFLTNQGRVFSAGNGANGQLGVVLALSPEFEIGTQPAGFAGLTAVSIAAGESTSMVAFDNGAIYVFGLVGGVVTSTPTAVTGLDASLRWQSVAVRSTVWYAVSTTGAAYSWGTSTVGGLCQGETTASPNPTQIEFTSSTAVTIASVNAGIGFAFFHQYDVANARSYIWRCGQNDLGQLGNGNTTNVLVPQLDSLPYLAVSKPIIKDISVGKAHALVLFDNDLGIYGCGNNADHQAGTTGAATITALTKIALPDALVGRLLKRVSAGVATSFIVSAIALRESTTSPLATNAAAILLDGWGLYSSLVSVQFNDSTGALSTCATQSVQGSSLNCVLATMPAMGPLKARAYTPLESSNWVTIRNVEPGPTIVATPLKGIPYNAYYLKLTGTNLGHYSVQNSSSPEPAPIITITPSSLACYALIADDTTLECELFGTLTGSETLMTVSVTRGGGSTQVVAAGFFVLPPIVTRTDFLMPSNAPQLVIFGINFGTDPAAIRLDLSPITASEGFTCPIASITDTAIYCSPTPLPDASMSGPIQVLLWRNEGPSNRATPAQIGTYVAPPEITPDTTRVIAQNLYALELFGNNFGTNSANLLVQVYISSQSGPAFNCHVVQAAETVAACLLVYTPLSPAVPLGKMSAVIYRNGGPSQVTQIGTVIASPSISPTVLPLARSATVVKIRGSNFGVVAIDSYVTLSEGACTVTASTATEIHCTVTTGWFNVTGPLYANVTANYGTAPQNSQVAVIVPPPTISETDDSSIGIGSTSITVRGTGFDPDVAGNTVMVRLNDAPPTPCAVTSASATEIQCTVPADYINDNGVVFATVTSHGGTVEASVGVATAAPISSGAIAGIVVAVIIIVIAIAVALILYIRRRLKVIKDIKSLEMTTVPDEMQHIFNIRSSDLEIIQKLGEGSYGAVYLGRFHKAHVAIKKLAASMMSSNVSDFFREASLMLSIPPHKNVVRVYGMCQELNNFSLVMEFLPNGSLDSYVQKQMKSGKKIPPEVLFRVVRGIARGMAHLASQNIVHRDLAARNILLDANFEPKVSDFGFSRVVGESGQGKTSAAVGPLRWMPPESLRDKEYSEKSDVWAYAITILEIMTGNEPWPEDDMIQVAVKVRDEGLTAIDQFPKGTPKYLKRVVKWCWMAKPEDRPTFTEIADFLMANVPEGVDVAVLDADDENAAVEAGLRAQRIERQVRRESTRAEKKLRREESRKSAAGTVKPASPAGGVYNAIAAEESVGTSTNKSNVTARGPPEDDDAPATSTNDSHKKTRSKKSNDDSDTGSDGEPNKSGKRSSSKLSKQSSHKKPNAPHKKKPDNGGGGTNYGALNV